MAFKKDRMESDFPGIDNWQWDHLINSGNYGCTDDITIEDLYQAFKARLISELGLILPETND